MKESSIELKQGKMYYYVEGNGYPIVFLHGWGQSFSTFNNVSNHLKGKFKIIGVDFLGFGKSKEPSVPLSVQDYTEHLSLLLKKLNINNPIIIAHSFGGRIAMRYAKLFNTHTLILIGSAGIKTRNFQYYIKVYRFKLLKFIYKIFSKEKYEKLINTSGSADYRNASLIMKQTLSKVVNYNSKPDMKRIVIDTHLLWGVYDKETPYENCVKMHKLIKSSRIITFYNSGHFLYQDEEKKFIFTIDKILSRIIWKR